MTRDRILRAMYTARVYDDPCRLDTGTLASCW
jgi:hypothetical protein